MQRCLGCMREFGDEFDVCPHCGYLVGTEAVSKNHLAPGTVLQNRYTLGKVLGQGGFGITYIAWDAKIGRAVAVKEYMPNALASRMTGEKEISCYNDEAQRQFTLGLEKTRKETHALSRFNALESVVKVHDCIEENGTAYIIMELLRGKTVKEILSERGKLSFAETMRIMTPVLQTLDAMHSVGMIHRDVAPDNIFVCDDGKIKLLDFGAARVVNTTDEKTLSVVLKAGYAPVEQYSSKAKQGAYTDVYAASATVYKMLTGETPPDSLSREKDGSDLAALPQTDAPQSAQETILHGMATDAQSRIQSVKELLGALQKDMPETVAGIDPKDFLQEQKKKQTKKILRIVIAAALVVCLVIGTVLIVQHIRQRTDATEEDAALYTDSAEEDELFLLEQSESTMEELSTDEAESDAAQDNTQWIAAYKKYLLERIRQDKAEAEDPDALDDYSERQFALIYLDNDDIPELVVSEATFHYAYATLVTCGDGELQTFSGLGTWGTFQYKERQGLIVEEDAHSGVSGATVWRLTQGSLQCVWSGYEAHPEIMLAEGGEPEYYIRDTDVVTAFQGSQDESAYEKLHAAEKKVTEAEYSAAYTANMPTGLVNVFPENNVYMAMTQKNVEKYFAALADRGSVTTIRAYTELKLSGTVSETITDYDGREYRSFELDEPIIVQFAGDAFPVLLTEIRIEDYSDDSVQPGHTTLTVMLSKDESGTVYA